LTRPGRTRWAHEIKHDGLRIQIHTGPAGVRLFTMSGYDCRALPLATMGVPRIAPRFTHADLMARLASISKERRAAPELTVLAARLIVIGYRRALSGRVRLA
jgi:ATP-dependent DNA ligase